MKQQNIKTPIADPTKLLIHNNELIVQSRGSNIVSFFDINSFQEIRRIEHDNIINTVFLREGKIYVSSVDRGNQEYTHNMMWKT